MKDGKAMCGACFRWFPGVYPLNGRSRKDGTVDLLRSNGVSFPWLCPKCAASFAEIYTDESWGQAR